MQFKPAIVSALTLTLLTACGGGGGGSSDKPVNSSSKASSSKAASSASGTKVDYTAVTGLYDASKTSNNIKDESYLYIDADGKVSAYNYMGDSKDMGDNCYKLATGSDINAALNGKTLSYTNSQFSADTGKNVVTWVVSGGAVTQIKLNSGLTSGGTMSVSLNGETFVLGTAKITTPSITDITGALCQ